MLQQCCTQKCTPVAQPHSCTSAWCWWRASLLLLRDQQAAPRWPWQCLKAMPWHGCWLTAGTLARNEVMEHDEQRCILATFMG